MERQEPFRPDEVYFLGMAVDKYNPPLERPYSEYATDEYDKKTFAQAQKMRNELSAEANAKGLKGKDKGDYINKQVNPYTAEREKQREAAIKKRIEELEIEVPEAINKCKKVNDLPACVNDISWALNFFTEEMSVKPEHTKLLVVEELFDKFVKHVPP